MTQAVALYVVATPIGNLNDITLRALQILSGVDCVAAEDTRHTQQLLAHHQIQARLLSLHEHNEAARLETVLNLLRDGQSIALVSDAGTPLISDPGFVLVNAVRSAGFPVVPIPGPSALIAALSVAGVAVLPFAFYGFLPRTASARQDTLSSIRYLQQTAVFYEASHRIDELLQDILQVCGAQRGIVLAKELTKLHETIYRATVADVIAWLAEDVKRKKGEFVVLLEREPHVECPFLLQVDQILTPLLALLPPKQVAAAVAAMTGLKKNDLYKRILESKREQ